MSAKKVIQSANQGGLVESNDGGASVNYEGRSKGHQQHLRRNAIVVTMTGGY